MKAKKRNRATIYESSILVKIGKEDRKIFQTMAKEFTKGNMSAWVRIAGRNFRPSKSQLKAA